MRTIGIDPGVSGGIALLDGGKLVFAEKMKDKTLSELWHRIAECEDGDTFCMLEKVSATPQMGVSSAFKFGQSFGTLEGMITASGIPWEHVTPSKWQKLFGLLQSGRKIGQSDTAKKRLNRQKAAMLFPEIRVTHAVADALLIAEYAWRSRSWMEAMSS